MPLPSSGSPFMIEPTSDLPALARQVLANVDPIRPQRWLLIIQLLTNVQEAAVAAQLSHDEWALVSAAYDHALAEWEKAGSVDRVDIAARRMNLTVVVLRT